MQQSFFNTNATGADTALKISIQKKVLSKNQQSFNKLTARITNLRKEIETTNDKMVKLSSIYNTEISVAKKELGVEKIALAKSLGVSYKTIKLTEKQTQEVESIIFDLLDDAFCVIMPDEEAEKLYDSVAEDSYLQAEGNEKSEIQEDFEEELLKKFGFNAGFKDFMNDTDEFAKFQEEFRQKMIEQQEQQTKKKKTKKQLEKEEIVKQQEEIKKRSIRSIYMSLAKLLHPDTEMDEIIKKEKEDIMKEITKAYNENDLSTLLKLELKWVAQENDHLEKLSDDKLKIYISVLKEQVKELEMEAAMQINNPAFEAILPFVEMPENFAVNNIKKEKQRILAYIKYLHTHTIALQGTKLRAAIRECITHFNSNLRNHDDSEIEDQLDIKTVKMMMDMFMGKGKKR